MEKIKSENKFIVFLKKYKWFILIIILIITGYIYGVFSN